MDATAPTFSKSRYEEVKENLSFYLTEIGYDITKISFLPISALYGDNIIDKSNNLDWYKGDTLLEAMNKIQMPATLNMPLRMPIELVTRDGCFGRVESGRIRLGMHVCVGPIGLFTKITELEVETYKDIDALPGDNATLMFNNVKRSDIRPGSVVSNSGNPAIKCLSFQAKIYVMGIISPGLQAILECHTTSVGILFSNFLTTVDGKTGRTLKYGPKSVEIGEVAMVELIPAKPLIVERVSDYPGLGRFLVRDVTGTLLAVGVVTTVIR